MNTSKFIVAVGACVAMLVMTVTTASANSLRNAPQELSTDSKNLKKPWPLKPPAEISEKTETIQDDTNALRHLPAFSATQLPSGRLLEAGAFFKRDVILKNSSLKPVGITRDDFNDSLDELRRAEINTLRSSAKKAQPNLYNLSRSRAKSNTYPLSIALLDYETVDQSVVKEAKSFEKYFQKNSKTKFGETKVFSAAAVQSDVVYGQRAQFVIPKEMVFIEDHTQIYSLTFEMGGDKQKVQLDRPFEVDLTPQLNLQKQTNNTRFERSFKLFINTGVTTYVAKGLFMWSNPIEAARNRAGRLSMSCFDLPQITASQSYANERAKINVRVYPAQGTVTNLGANDMSCNNGTAPRLKQVLVVVDGFDPADNRTQESILEDFGPAITGFVSAGFDVVSVDYENGRDYIQKNGLAVRELLVNHIPNWKTADAENRVVVVAGSMGTQTSRYAMRTAELAGEAHDVALWLAIDGPFQGANIPISLQAFVEFFSFSPSGRENLEGLDSRAASQQLLLNRYYDPSRPRSGIVPSNTWYVPRQEFYSYYGEMVNLGLPQQSRNIAISSGSGNGRLQGPTAAAGASKVKFLRLNYETGLDLVIVRTLAQSDHGGEAFYGRYKVPGFLCNWPFNEADFCANWTLRLNINYPKRLDTAPGGFRTSPTDIVELWNANQDGTMYSDFETHNFIPTSSSLNIPTNNAFYQPHYDGDAHATSGFDRIWYESCNAKHVEQTSGMWSVIQQELSYFLSGSTPTIVRPPTTIPNCDNTQPSVNYTIESASTVREGEELTVVVRRSAPATSAETVRVMVVGGTATAGADYATATAGQYSGLILMNSDVATIRISTTLDNLNEGTESVVVRLQGSTYADAGFPATFSPITATGYIENSNTNDVPLTASCYADLVSMIDGPNGQFPNYRIIGNASGSNPVIERRVNISGSDFGPWVASGGNNVTLVTNLYPGGPGQASQYFIRAEFKDSVGNIASASCSTP